MKIETSDSYTTKEIVAGNRSANACPVKGCQSRIIHEVLTSKSGKKSDRFHCPEHGLEIRGSTFIYYNGDTVAEKQQAKLRNVLPELRDYTGKWILGNKHKAESHRLGYENSEDALTLNIFGWLHLNKKLPSLYEYLTGNIARHDQLKLYLWGLEIDFVGSQPELWTPLQKVRSRLERDVRRFKTEPDIMILGPADLVCIEAKFTSGNPICVDEQEKAGEKPRSKERLVKKYITANDLWQKRVLEPEDIVNGKLHSQLLRMIVFTSTMAQLHNPDLNWRVINLVSATQWKLHRAHQYGYDFQDPTPFIPMKVRDRFRFFYWEQLFDDILKEQKGFEKLASYTKTKTANLQPAFT